MEKQKEEKQEQLRQEIEKIKNCKHYYIIDDSLGLEYCLYCQTLKERSLKQWEN